MATENTFKFTCPYCGQHLDAEYDMIGMSFDCPACGQSLTVPEINDEPSVEAENARPVVPVITIVKRRERFIDKFKKRWKMVGAGIAVLLLFAGIGVIKENFYSAVSAATDKPEGAYTERTTRTDKSRTKAAAEAKTVMTSLECLLNYVEMPNDRRLKVLSRNLETCPEDFADAVKKFLISASRTSQDMISDSEREDMIKGKIVLGLLFGAVNKNDPQRGVAAGLQLGDLISAKTQEAADQRLKQEVESKLNHLLNIAERYGVDPNKLETALLSRMR